MSVSLKVEVEPSVMKWAIDSSGWKKDELVDKLKISSNTYEGWRSGNVKPTIKQLEELSNKIKRPLASFLLDKPPVEKPVPKDYRMLPTKSGVFDKKTVLAIRKARRLQTLAHELSRNIQTKDDAKITKQTIKDNPKQVAQIIRKKFELDIEKQRKFKNPYELYNLLREILEEYNIFSFQISMPLEDARGFALADETPAIIVVNSADNIEPRIFTLMHEFGHILLGETAISIPNFTHQDRIERWCNQFAASFLLPENIAKEIFSGKKTTLTATATLNSLSRKYKVSKAMLLYSMQSLDFLSKKEVDNVLDRHKRKEQEAKEVKKSGGGISQEKKCRLEMGNKFISLVADNVDKKIITHSDALSYLSVKTKNLNKVLSRV